MLVETEALGSLGKVMRNVVINLIRFQIVKGLMGTFMVGYTIKSLSKISSGLFFKAANVLK